MKFFTRQFNTPSIRLYPLADFHYGSPQCDETLVKQVIKQIKDDPIGYWVGMADFMENAIIGSKSDVYTQVVPPREQLNHVYDLLSPIRDKGLFLIGGNHEQRTHRLVGMDPSELLAEKLDLPFRGFSCLAFLQTRSPKNPRGFKCYFHHKGHKRTNFNALRLIVPDADAVFGAHVHDTSREPVTWYDCSYDRIITRFGCNYRVGNALTWNDSYAEEKTHKPATPEFICVEFVGATSGRGDNRKQIYTVIRREE
jgi:hypothetical protein